MFVDLNIEKKNYKKMSVEIALAYYRTTEITNKKPK